MEVQGQSEVEEGKREELKVDEEVPLEIKDYTSINGWEQLVTALEFPLIKWNISRSSKCTPPDDPYTSTDLAEEFTFSILAPRFYRIGKLKFKLSYRHAHYSIGENLAIASFGRYLSEAHMDLSRKPFPARPNEIPLLFGITKFLCVELSSSGSESIALCKTLLSALQIAAQNHNVNLPVFVKMPDPKVPVPIIFGYLGFYANPVTFSTYLFNDFQNGATKYPTLRSILTDCMHVRKVLNVIYEATEVQATAYHYFTGSATDARKVFLKNDIIQSISVIASKTCYTEDGMYFDKKGKIEKGKVSSAIWGEFASKSDEVVVKMETYNKKLNKFDGKLANCLKLIDELGNSKGSLKKSMHAFTIDFSSIDQNQIKDLEIIRKGTENKWKALCLKAGSDCKKPKDMEKLKPCCIFSSYGVLLRDIYTAKSTDYVRGLWLNYLKCLRNDWENEKTFKLIELESARNYESKVYKTLQFLAAAAYLYGKVVNYLEEETKDSVEIGTELLDLQNESSQIMDDLEEITWDGSEAIDEDFRSYSPHERIVLINVPESQEEKDLEILYEKLGTDADLKDKFRKSILNIMAQYMVSSKPYSTTYKAFLKWITQLKKTKPVLEKVFGLFSEEELEQLWEKRTSTQKIQTLMETIEKEVEITFSHLETIPITEVLLDSIFLNAYKKILKGLILASWSSEKQRETYTRIVYKKIQDMVFKLENAKEKPREAILSCVEVQMKARSLLMKYPFLPRYSPEEIKTLESIIESLVEMGKYRTNKAAEYEVAYNPVLRGLKLGDLRAPNEREFILRYNEQKREMVLPNRIYVKVKSNLLHIASAISDCDI